MVLLLLACVPYHPPARTPPLLAARGHVTTVPVPGEDVRVAIRAGSAYDPPGREGLAAVTAAAVATAAGGRVAVGSEVVVFSVAPDQRDALFRALAEAPSEAAVEEVRGAPIPASSCLSLAENTLGAWLFYGHPYGHPTLGRHSVRPTLTAAEVAGFQRLRYVRGAAVVGLPEGAPPPPADLLAPVLSRPATPAPLDRGGPATQVLVVEAPGVDGACVAVGHRLDALDETGRAALQLARASWGGFPSRELRLEPHVSLARTLPAATPSAPGDAALDFAHLATVGLSEPALDAARAAVVAARTPEDTADDLLWRALLGLPPPTRAEDLPPALVAGALRGLLRPTAVRVVLVTSDAKSFRDVEGRPPPDVEVVSALELVR